LNEVGDVLEEELGTTEIEDEERAEELLGALLLLCAIWLELLGTPLLLCQIWLELELLSAASELELDFSDSLADELLCLSCIGGGGSMSGAQEKSNKRQSMVANERKRFIYTPCKIN